MLPKLQTTMHILQAMLALCGLPLSATCAPCTAGGRFAATSKTKLSVLGLQVSIMYFTSAVSICSELATARVGLPFCARLTRSRV